MCFPSDEEIATYEISNDPFPDNVYSQGDCLMIPFTMTVTVSELDLMSLNVRMGQYIPQPAPQLAYSWDYISINFECLNASYEILNTYHNDDLDEPYVIVVDEITNCAARHGYIDCPDGEECHGMTNFGLTYGGTNIGITDAFANFDFPYPWTIPAGMSLNYGDEGLEPTPSPTVTPVPSTRSPTKKNGKQDSELTTLALALAVGACLLVVIVAVGAYYYKKNSGSPNNGNDPAGQTEGEVLYTRLGPN